MHRTDRTRAEGSRLMLPVLLVLALGSAGATARAEEAGSDAGRRIFTELAQPACGICHALADADAQGTLGPSLDELKPTREQVVNALRNAPGVMPDYADTLTAEQIEAVADYVSEVAGAP